MVYYRKRIFNSNSGLPKTNTPGLKLFLQGIVESRSLDRLISIEILCELTRRNADCLRLLKTGVGSLEIFTNQLGRPALLGFWDNVRKYNFKNL